MLINPLPEDKAPDSIKECYQNIRKALNSKTLPVFFTYLGSFPEYLEYISRQLLNNLNDPSFNKTVNDLEMNVIRETNKVLVKPFETKEFIANYKHNPYFYNFQKDLREITLINSKLACIFIALREAVKGWAVAAKKLPDRINIDEPINVAVNDYEEKKEIYLFDKPIITESKSLVAREKGQIEKNLLPQYLHMCNLNFDKFMEKDYFWHLRVAVEEKILAQLAVFPEIIFSPFNVIVGYTQKYENFYELLYLLYEKFPTLVAQRLIFSAYMMADD